MMEATMRGHRFEYVNQFMSLDSHAHPSPGLSSVVEQSDLTKSKPKVILHILSTRRNFGCEQIHVLESMHTGSAPGITLGLVVQSCELRLGGLKPFSLVIDLKNVTVRVSEPVGWTVTDISFIPS